VTGKPARRGARARPDRPRETWLGPAPGGVGAGGRLSVVVLSPSRYPLAMSNLGFQSAVSAFAAMPGVRCERAFWEGKAPRSRETDSPLGDFDLVALSVSFELDYLHVVSALAAARLPLRAVDRAEDDPLVVAGGVCAFLNPEPLSDFLDAVLVGDAEALVPPVVESLVASRGAPRVERLTALARVPGVYVPSFYRVERGTAGAAFTPTRGAPLPVRPALKAGALAQSTVLSDQAFFEDMFLIEASRGCGRGCRFCAAGHVYVPQRTRPAKDLLDAVRGVRDRTKRIGVVSAALGDHPESLAILRAVNELGIELNVSSLRAEVVSRELASLLASAGVRTVTIAPETGTEALREIAGKPTRDATLLRAAGALAEGGIERLKLYFMIGLPGERESDVQAIPALARELHAAFVKGRPGAKVSVGVSGFVPKPRTPFQWLPMARERELRDKLAAIRRALSGRPHIEFTGEGPRESRMEGVLARGGREFGAALKAAAVDGVPWKAAMKRAGIDPESIIGRDYGDHETFPWEVVDAGVSRPKLLASLRAARRLIDRRP